MNKSWIPLVAILLSAVACILSGAALLGRSNTQVAAAALPPSDAAQIQDLVKRIAELRAEVDRLSAPKLESPEPRTPRESVGTAGSISPEMEKRLSTVESAVAALERQAKAQSAAARPTAEGRPDLEAARLAATDPRLRDEDKLAALKALRNQQINGQDARSHDVLLSMIDVANRSTDENVRLDVYRNLHGASDQVVRDSMLHALANDASAKVREKCAEDIDTFLPDALVVSALRQAAEFDPDAKVRQKAAKTLGEKH